MNTEHCDYEQAIIEKYIRPRGESPDNGIIFDKEIKEILGLGNRPFFLEELSAALTRLGEPCAASDTEKMTAAVRRLYSERLGIACPRAVVNWTRGDLPGVTAIRNNYELCFALGMTDGQTADFFRKAYLTLPFNVKAREDAVFYYCLVHGRPYSAAAELLEKSGDAPVRLTEGSSTLRVRRTIDGIEDDGVFLEYLRDHCYGNELRLARARARAVALSDELKKKIKREKELNGDKFSPGRLNTAVIEMLLGYNYQKSTKFHSTLDLPYLFKVSLPNDTTLGKLLGGGAVSYETARKTLMLLKFHTYFNAALDRMSVADIELNEENVGMFYSDFESEMNSLLDDCGLPPVYFGHPFDCALMYCACQPYPLEALSNLTEKT